MAMELYGPTVPEAVRTVVTAATTGFDIQWPQGETAFFGRQRSRIWPITKRRRVARCL